MKYLISIIGLLAVVGLALLVSSNRKQIKYKYIGLMVVIQIALAALLLNTKFGFVLIQGIATVFGYLLEFAEAGISL